MSQKKRSIYAVTVTDPRGQGVSGVSQVTIYVRHESARQAKAWVQDTMIESDRASDEDIMEIGRSNTHIFGPFEKPPLGEPSPQLDAFQPPADPEAAAAAIDAENRRNASIITGDIE